jgi:peptidoglycan-associated lipoprotein
MNNAARILVSVMLVAGVAACAKKAVKTEARSIRRLSPIQPAGDTGRYKVGDLDSDSCLRQRASTSISIVPRSPEFSAQISAMPNTCVSSRTPA